MLTSSLDTRGGRFHWAVNPSTRPVVAGRDGREPQGPAQPAITLTNPAGVPAVGGSEFRTFEIMGRAVRQRHRVGERGLAGGPR